MKCDIIMPVWNQPEFTRRSIEHIKKNTAYPYRLIVIDNGSGPETRDYLREVAHRDSSVILIRNEENLGFIKATNQGLRASDAPYVCLMNNDTAASEGWLAKMIDIARSDPRIGLVNPRSDSPGRLSVEEYGRKLAGKKGEYIETNQCMGYCMLIKREVIDKIGHLDEVYGIGGFDDTDFSKRAHIAGYKCVCAKDAYVYHDWHTSFKAAGGDLLERLVRRNEPIFFDKWAKYLRIGYPVSFDGDRESLRSDINVSLGLAREWNWVHLWLNADKKIKKDPLFAGLPEHQNLRIFHMPGSKAVFYTNVLFKLTERRLKGKKFFDAVLVSDKKLAKLLNAFKWLFSTPVFYVERNNGAPETAGFNEEVWREKARHIVKMVKGGV